MSELDAARDLDRDAAITAAAACNTTATALDSLQKDGLMVTTATWFYARGGCC